MWCVVPSRARWGLLHLLGVFRVAQHCMRWLSAKCLFCWLKCSGTKSYSRLRGWGRVVYLHDAQFGLTQKHRLRKCVLWHLIKWLRFSYILWQMDGVYTLRYVSNQRWKTNKRTVNKKYGDPLPPLSTKTHSRKLSIPLKTTTGLRPVTMWPQTPRITMVTRQGSTQWQNIWSKYIYGSYTTSPLIITW